MFKLAFDIPYTFIHDFRFLPDFYIYVTIYILFIIIIIIIYLLKQNSTNVDNV